MSDLSISLARVADMPFEITDFMNQKGKKEEEEAKLRCILSRVVGSGRGPEVTGPSAVCEREAEMQIQRMRRQLEPLLSNARRHAGRSLATLLTRSVRREAVSRRCQIETILSRWSLSPIVSNSISGQATRRISNPRAAWTYASKMQFAR